MEKLTKGIIIGLIVGLIIGIVVGYFLHGLINRSMSGRGNFQGNFQIDDNTKNEITSFFDSNPDTATITSYCQQNKENCVYYCSNINRNSPVCSSILNMSRGGMPQK
ncbi:MAG: hypothetical protein WC796_04810 [Candidatus Pacearchaeota archaeon]|jgi:hypothetical protein